MRKASWHKTKGCFGGAELRGPSKHPYLQEEMLSVNKELFIEPGSQKALFWGRQLCGYLQYNHDNKGMAFMERRKNAQNFCVLFSLILCPLTVDPLTFPGSG